MYESIESARISFNQFQVTVMRIGFGLREKTFDSFNLGLVLGWESVISW